MVAVPTVAVYSTCSSIIGAFDLITIETLVVILYLFVNIFAVIRDALIRVSIPIKVRCSEEMQE